MFRLVLLSLNLLVALIVLLTLLCAAFFPSYTTPPPHYSDLRTRVDRNPTRYGLANINNENIFIAAALYDPQGTLISGDWAQSVVRLIEILGPENVHLSIYENDGD